ncbi:hypothetical protein [Agromyces flavus]|uniref:hypothetical protein n=1 Tax=Agromyces flavus TaxID=589382 RepID=UPI00166403E3|nr:hypothetical protein [Agromyces flavus]GGI47359.1 hypothetical protein GCM10010932_20470 [Agromyces flavus]
MDARRPRAARVLTAVFLLLAAFIIVLEIDRLIAGSLSQDGAGSPLGSVIGPFALASREAWGYWASNAAAGTGSVAWLIGISLAVDLLIIVVYVWIFRRLIKRMTPARRPAASATLVAAVVFEAVEFVLLVIGAILLASGGAGHVIVTSELFGVLVACASTGKWVFLALLVVLLLRDHVEGVRRSGSRGFIAELSVRIGQALWVHRLSAFLIAGLFLFACIPSDGVLDQLPDIQRQWVGMGWPGLGHAIAAGAAVGVAALCALVLGRARSRALVSAADGFNSYAVPTSGRDVIWWLVPIGIWVVLFLLTLRTTGDAGFAPIAAVFLAIPAIVIASYFVTAWWPSNIDGRVDYPVRAEYAWLVGDLTAAATVGIGGLGLIRSFTAPVLAGPGLSGGGWPYAGSLAALITGVVVVMAAPRIVLWHAVPDPLLDPAQRLDRPEDAALAHRHRTLLVIFFLAGVAILAFLAFFPIQLATLLGGAAVTVLALTAWGAVLGAFTVAVQDRQPAPLFRVMRLRANPVLTLAITIPLIVSMILALVDRDDPALHAARGAVEASQTDDAGEDEGFRSVVDTRLAALAEAGCLAGTNGGETFIPAVVVVAEGGGIRAAYWTTRALEALRDHGGCLADSILLSSGVSGGSVGLAATAASTKESGAKADLRKLAGPTTVGTGVAALLVGDLLATDTGVHFPSLWKNKTAWQDRAALIEQTWIDAVPGLADPVALAASDRIGIPVLNSTDARSKCKLLVASHVAGSGELTCASGAMSPAATLPMGSGCFARMDWATSAMLSARFPIITPAARLGERDGCGTEDLQLIDGGYAEGSGLGTAADLAPTIADAIAEWNMEHDDANPIVPVLVFMKNSAGYDLREDLDAVSAEPLVPVVGFAAASKQAAQSAWIQRIGGAFGTVGTGSDAASQAIDDIHDVLPALTVVVAPSTEPAVVPPLGWALSGYSTGSLDRAIATQLCPSLRDGVPTLRSLTAMVPDATPAECSDRAQTD